MKKTEWLDGALACYEDEKSKNPDYISFDNAMIKAFARRIVGQIKEQMKLDNERCELLLNAILRKTNMNCPKCGRELRMFSERKLDYRKYKKYKCDNCKQITELEIDNRDRIIKVNHYENKF